MKAEPKVMVWRDQFETAVLANVDNPPLLVARKSEIREYKAMFVLNDEEIGIFSHELVANCAP